MKTHLPPVVTMERHLPRQQNKLLFIKTKTIMKKYVCDVCGYIYDPAVGDPDNGIAPGTAFEDIPEDWVCPTCGVTKEDFSEVEE